MNLKRTPKTTITEEEWEWVIRDTFHNFPIDETLDKIGMTRPEFNRYLKKNEKRNQEFEQAKIDAIPFLENDFSNPSRKMDPKEAALKSANLQKVLVARMPEKYGNKLDLNLNQTISIKDNIDKADSRLIQSMRDVVEIAAPKKDEEKE